MHYIQYLTLLVYILFSFHQILEQELEKEKKEDNRRFLGLEADVVTDSSPAQTTTLSAALAQKKKEKKAKEVSGNEFNIPFSLAGFFVKSKYFI